MSTVETFIGLLRQEASILNQVVIETANSFDDLIVTGSQQKALDALRTLVAAASAADGEESEQGTEQVHCLWFVQVEHGSWCQKWQGNAPMV